MEFQIIRKSNNQSVFTSKASDTREDGRVLIHVDMKNTIGIWLLPIDSIIHIDESEYEFLTQDVV